MQPPSDAKKVSPQGLPLYKAGKSRPSLFSATDRNREVRALNALKVWLVKFVEGSLGRVLISDSNVVLELPPPGTGDGTPSSTGGTKDMLVKTVYGDHLDCCAITDTGLTGTTTPVGKSRRNRRSITGETIGGNTIAYAYAAVSGYLDYGRTASCSGFINQLELLIPAYLSGEPILVNQIDSVTLDGVACTWEEAVPRKWCQYG